MKSILKKLKEAFPQMYINKLNEAIIHPRNNIFFRLEDCETEDDVIAKLLNWLSRPAHKGVQEHCQDYILDGINYFIGETFTKEDMCRIYCQMGNAVNNELTKQFITSHFDMGLLEELPDHMKGIYK